MWFKLLCIILKTYKVFIFFTYYESCKEPKEEDKKFYHIVAKTQVNIGERAITIPPVVHFYQNTEVFDCKLACEDSKIVSWPRINTLRCDCITPLLHIFYIYYLPKAFWVLNSIRFALQSTHIWMFTQPALCFVAHVLLNWEVVCLDSKEYFS